MITLSEDNFQQIIDSEKPVLVDCFAPWCGPCRALAPTFEKWSQAHSDKMIFCKVDVDECKNIGQQYKIHSIPTVILFASGKEVKRWVGMPVIDEITKTVEGLNNHG